MSALAQAPAADPRYAHQVELETLYNKNQTVPRIRKEFETCQDIDFAGVFTHVGIPVSFGFDLLTQMALHKRATLPVLVAILRSHFKGASNASQMAADCLLKAAHADLVDWCPVLRQFIVKFTMSQDVQDDLDRYQYPLPMVVEPLEVKTNRDTGYVLDQGSIILKKNHHNNDVCLDHINRVNKIRFTFDLETATMIKNRWRNLDRPKAGETRDEFQKRKRAFEKYDRTTKDVMSILLQHGNEFYLTHKYDKRGRIYSQGYHVNYQGAPWNKAVIQLADKEYVT